MAEALQMDPPTGSQIVRIVGDRLRIRLPGPADARALLRTTVGGIEGLRQEATRLLRPAAPRGDGGWRDVAMRHDGEAWTVDLLLTEPGHFRFKARLVIDEVHHWPDGPDGEVVVHPAWTRSGNTIYCAFPRMFGPNRDLRRSEDELRDRTFGVLEDFGYAVLPPSGTLRDVVRHLDHIMGTLGCRILHLLPITPTPTTYARMGRFGSPYAALDFTAIDPALVEFDRRTTGIDQFQPPCARIERRFTSSDVEVEQQRLLPGCLILNC